METKGMTCKIPLDLHNQMSEEIRATESTLGKFIEMVIREHFANKKGMKDMENTRTLALQVPEELFQKVKRYLAWYEEKYGRKLTQREFLIDVIESALNEVEGEIRASALKLAEQTVERVQEAQEGPEHAEGGEQPAESETGDAGEETAGQAEVDFSSEEILEAPEWDESCEQPAESEPDDTDEETAGQAEVDFSSEDREQTLTNGEESNAEEAD